MEEQFIASAFVSCSLRPQDKPFVDFIESILRSCKVKPFGTVGKYSAAPINTAALMKANIPQADMVVMVATPRYFQQDVHTGKSSAGLGEMLHAESGIAYASDKPIIAFVQEGTDVGSFLPNITQYITIKDGRDLKDDNKRRLIISMFNNTFKIIKAKREQKSSSDWGKLIKGGLALYGGLKVLEAWTTPDKPKRRRTTTRKKK
jgi:hypothetical protein